MTLDTWNRAVVKSRGWQLTNSRRFHMFVVGLLVGSAVGCAETETTASGADPTAENQVSSPTGESDALPSIDPSLTTLPEPLPGRWSPVEGQSLKPFWRKGDEPTYAPEWYANRGDVTGEFARRPDESAEDAGQRLYETLQRLIPGDHLLIREGIYSISKWLTIRARGTEAEPIVIRGAPGENVVLTRPDAKKNVVDIDNSQYLVLESLQIRGGSNAVKIYTADHIMLYDLEVKKTAGVAIAANSKNTSYLSIVDCDISYAGKNGEGIYVGRTDGSQVTHHTAIVGNYIHDLVGPTVKQGDGIEVKQGSYCNWIKYNFVRNTNYPGIIVYGTGRGLDERNVIEENIIIDSHDYGIQASADAVIRNNLIVNSLPGGKTFVSKPEPASTPSNLLIVNNTFLAMGRAVNGNQWDGPDARGIVFANNAYYSETAEGMHDALGDTIHVGNLYVKDLGVFAEVNLSNGTLNAAPGKDSPLVGAGVISLTPGTDLNGVERKKDVPVIGALASGSLQPGG